MATATRVSPQAFPVVFVGAGNIAFGNDNVIWNHSLRVERCLGASLEVVGIVDPSAERVNHVLAQKRVSPAAACYCRTMHFYTLDEAAAHLNEDGVTPRLIIICAPPYFRGTKLPGRNLEEQTVAAFGPSPAIFCEKPISIARPYESAPVMEILEQSGNVISVGYMLRYLKVVQKVTSIIRDNDLKIMAVTARYTCAYSKIRKGDWWDKSKQCGPIVEQATHFCDLCRYLGGEVNMDSVRAYALEHYESPGELSHMAVTESAIPEQDRIPRATAAIWKFQKGALGSMNHLIALHGIRYSNEIVVTADGYQFRLVDLYTDPTLYVRSPRSEEEEAIAYPNDDPFHSEFLSLINSAISPSGEPRLQDDYSQGSTTTPNKVLSTYRDALRTHEFTWRIREESERSSKLLKEQSVTAQPSQVRERIE